MRQTSVTRAVRLMRRLESVDGPCYAWRDLMDEFGVSKRTLLRDVDALKAAGAVVETRRDEETGATRIGRLTWEAR